MLYILYILYILYFNIKVMDFEKLPLAHDSNILYMYKHPNAIKHIQSLYDENYTVNPRNIIKPVMPRERIIENKKKELKAKVSVSSFIVKDTIEKENIDIVANTENKENIVSVTETAINIEPTEPMKKTDIILETNEEASEIINSSVVTIGPIGPIDSWKFMVSNIDDTSSLYTENMWRDAIDSMKQKLIILMTSGAGHKKYGPKKSRTILAWLTDNKRGTPASAETALVIADFISWLLDIKVSSVETAKVNASWIMFRKRGVWMIRNNV